MADIKVKMDIGPLAQFLENFGKEVVSDMKKSVKALANETHAHIKKEAQNKLHSFKDKYLENLSPPEQEGDLLWVITLNKDAEWIEQGRPEPFDMKPGLLKNGKTSNGHKYRIIPMNQAKMPSEMPLKTKAYEIGMVANVKAELRKRNIPYKKLEMDPKTGSPKIGKLHSFDIDSNIPGKGNTPQLYGLNIYQTQQKDGSVKRSITTFRTVTDKPNQQDKWIHPSVEARNFLKEAKEFAEKEWESKILPEIIQKYKGKL